jgi:hypothetical protein
MTKDDMIAKIVWESERKANPFRYYHGRDREEKAIKDYERIQTKMFCWVLAVIILVLLIAFLLAPAEAKQKSSLTRLETCQLDYLFCAGRIVEKQAAYNAAVLMTHVCSNDMTPVAQYLDLATLPQFEVASVCQQHLGACGYYLAHWESVLKAKYAEVRAICK